ncbi:hypothetical protein ACU4GD_39210 [Cupriavidus basilensis]
MTSTTSGSPRVAAALAWAARSVAAGRWVLAAKAPWLVVTMRAPITAAMARKVRWAGARRGRGMDRTGGWPGDGICMGWQCGCALARRFPDNSGFRPHPVVPPAAPWMRDRAIPGTVPGNVRRTLPHAAVPTAEDVPPPVFPLVTVLACHRPRRDCARRHADRLLAAL